MGEVRPLPRTGEVFVDIRGEDRTMRISHHDDLGIVVISLWVSGLCRASFRLPLGDAPELISLLTSANSPSGAQAADERAAPEPITGQAGVPEIDIRDAA